MTDKKNKQPEDHPDVDEDLWEAFVRDVQPLGQTKPDGYVVEDFDQETAQQDSQHSNQPGRQPDLPHDMDYFQAVAEGQMNIEDIPDGDLTQLPTDQDPHDRQQTSPQKPSKTAAHAFVIAENNAQKLAGWRAGVDRKAQKNLARGKFRPTLDVDLHGFYLMDAYREVRAFLAHSAEEGHKCVLIIHGKGRSEGREMGVIKENLARFLSEQPQVLAFHTAQIKDGGTGACYVLIKRG